MKLCALFSRHGSLASRSGYDLLAEAMPSAHTITAPRGDMSGRMGRTWGRLLRAAAASRWYQGSSAVIERRALTHLRRVQPDVLHYLWTENDLGYLAPWVRTLSPGTRLCGTLHLPPHQMRAVMRFPSVLRRFDALITMSRSQAAYLGATGVDPARLHVIPHGIDTDFFRPGDKPSEMGRFRVLSVGGFLRDFAVLRDVCHACRAEEMDFEIIGPASVRSQFQALDNVTFRSGVSETELAQAYRQASCLLLTVIDATANNAMLEAMASGRPVVAERVGGVPDYLDESCALLCPAKDVGALRAALRSLAANPAAARSLGAGARQRAEQFAWPKIAAKTVALYASLLDG